MLVALLVALVVLFVVVLFCCFHCCWGCCDVGLLWKYGSVLVRKEKWINKTNMKSMNNIKSICK